MTYDEYIDVILNRDPNNKVLRIENEANNDPNRKSILFRFKDGSLLRMISIARQAYPNGVVYNSMPKSEIKMIEPEQKVIHTTDWIDEYFKTEDD